MPRISSRYTFFYKRIFPCIWFGFPCLFLVTAFSARSAGNKPPLPTIIVPVFMAAMGIFIMRKLIWDLADEVHDEGDSLIVRFGHEQEQILLSNIINVGYSYMMNPPRVTLTLRITSRFGSEISFMPIRNFNLTPFAKCPIVAQLIQRVDAARQAAK